MHLSEMNEVTAFQWIMLGIAFLGFAMTWTTGVIALTRAVDAINNGTSDKINKETTAITAKLIAMTEKFSEDQKTQDHAFGEVGAAIRQKIADVEKEMHTIEIWGRDNYALKSEFMKATDSIRDDIKALGAEIRTDIRDLADKVANQQ